MSLSKEEQVSPPPPSGRKSDDNVKERVNEANTKHEEVKGGMNPYFVSTLVCKIAVV
jgi:hypothetical protein